MAVHTFVPVLRFLRHLGSSGPAPADGELLEQYLATASEAAFSALVARHGRMVHGVCRRVLGNTHDADDAFQAVFLILMRKAHCVVRRESIGSWLHGVAYRTALKARTAARRRRTAESRIPPAGGTDDGAAAVWRELGPIMDEEIERLPDKYRLPFVLCYLESKTQAEAARLLAVPLGTVATRLAAARRQLRRHLTRRGASLAAGLVLAIAPTSDLAEGAAAPLLGRGQAPPWGGPCSKQATSLAQGVLRNMCLKRVRMAVGLLLAAMVAVCAAGLLLQRATAVESRADKPAPVAAATDAHQRRVIPPVVEAQLDPKRRCFTVECCVAQVYKDGSEEFLTRPQFRAMEGEPATSLVGQLWPVPGTVEGKADYVELGERFKVIVQSREAGRVRLDVDLQITQGGKSDDRDQAVISGPTLRAIKVMRPGETARFDFAFGDSHFRATFKVEEGYSNPQLQWLPGWRAMKDHRERQEAGGSPPK